MLKPQLADVLNDARDFPALTRVVVEICSPYGPLHSLQLVHNKRAGHVSCLIELDSPKQQPALKRALGGTGFGGSVYLEIPVRHDFARAAAEPAAAAPLHSGFCLASAHLP